MRTCFNKIAAMGFRATVLDQMEHLFQWYGRSAALGTRGYQINRIDGVDTFAINNGANDFRFTTHDSGLGMPLRRLFNRKARGDRDQVVILMSSWEDFTSKDAGRCLRRATCAGWPTARGFTASPWKASCATKSIWTATAGATPGIARTAPRPAPSSWRTTTSTT
jgi:hypothetical protein